MDKTEVEKTLKLAKDSSNKRNFNQTVDLIINLKDIDLKKQDNRVNIFSQLHFDRGKRVKICGLLAPELMEQGREAFDNTISADDFPKYAEKKKIKKLARENDFFVAQANIMPKVAGAFGKTLGPRGKMPNPKAGCVVPPNANLKALAEKLQKTLNIRVDTSPVFQTFVGKEDTEENKVVDNVVTIYNALAHALPNDVHNIKDAYLKLTMGKPFKIGGEQEQGISESGQEKKTVPKEKEKKKSPEPAEKEKVEQDN
ncbi:50S ribosomal protein L1 [Candidatus Woesearchaeota archaeon]|nr:50S ribosomal protein L1 [Candidatus Woesearchaeota archaeon]